MERKCEACPAEVHAVCRHAFGKFWGVKSHGGEGCDYPLDDAAKAWYAAGWKPNAPQARENAPVRVPYAGGVITLSRPAPAPQGAERGDSAIPPKMPRRPNRPKVSAAIMRQAEPFFKKN